MSSLLCVRGSRGAEVDRLRRKLAQVLGADAAQYAGLSAGDAPLDADTEAGIRRWQSGVAVIADGVAGPRCLLMLDLWKPPPLELELSLANVSRLFPATKPANIARYLPYIEAALAATGLTDRATVLAALGTIRAETEGFVPIAELPSRFNTQPGGRPFGVYDNRPKYGHTQPGDGERYRGRGFVQLTWKANYEQYGKKLGIALAENPDWANAPEVAAMLLAVFLADRADKLRQAVARGDLAGARKLVNGGAHGLDRFSDVFARAALIWPVQPAAPRGRRAVARKALAQPAAAPRTSLTRRDSADLRDRPYIPPAVSLPAEFPPAEEIKRFLPAYTKAGMILDQGQEGACTGFGLSCVVNVLRWLRDGLPPKMESVSPRMLYTLARRHDEYAGDKYDGSSCRGALKGWYRHGVCLESDWPYEPERSSPPKYGYAERAAGLTLGVYYRIDIKCIADLQAAIVQGRAIFVSATTHAGWDAVPSLRRKPAGHEALPLIPFDGRPSEEGGHAFALVGFNSRGFVLQNSWGTGWGAGGFAVIGYQDWLANAMDAWVVSLGVPGVVAGRLAAGAAGGAAVARGVSEGWWQVGNGYRHSVVLGNDGRVARYLTEDEPPRKLQQQAFVLPDQWFRGHEGARKRLVLYAHGGLNSEAEAIRRACAMGRCFTGNGCYPLFLVWKTGLLESIGNILSEALRREPALPRGLGEWLGERSDSVVEKTIGRPLARPLWSEMKENADLACESRRGLDVLVDALQALADSWGDQFELHLVGHSAGSILLGRLLELLARRGLTGLARSLHLYAPACSVAFANRCFAPHEALMQQLWLDVLSDARERADSVALVYRKSLLYLVSNALEADRRTPLLGMEKVLDEGYAGWDGSSGTAEALGLWRRSAEHARLAQRTGVLAAERIAVAVAAPGHDAVDAPAGHGSFDNNVDVVRRTLERITGGPLALPVDDLRGF